MLSASAMILIGLLGIWLGGVVFHLLVALICGMMVWELVGMLRGPGQAETWQLGLVTGVAVLASVYLPVGLGLPLLLALARGQLKPTASLLSRPLSRLCW